MRDLDPLTRIASAGWQLVMAPFHARRIADKEMATRRAIHKDSLDLEECVAPFYKTVELTLKMEHELETMDLALDTSRQAVVVGFQASVARLKHRLSAICTEDAVATEDNKAGEKADQEPINDEGAASAGDVDTANGPISDGHVFRGKNLQDKGENSKPAANGRNFRRQTSHLRGCFRQSSRNNHNGRLAGSKRGKRRSSRREMDRGP